METISNRASLLSYTQYRALHKVPPSPVQSPPGPSAEGGVQKEGKEGKERHAYFQAGSYDPVSQELTWAPDLLPHLKL